MIRFGFDESLVVDKNGKMIVPYPNSYNKEIYKFDLNTFLSKYGKFPINEGEISVEDKIFLIGRSICVNLNDDIFYYKQDTVDNFIDRNEDFIYSLLIWDNSLFENEETLILSDKVLNQIKLKKCKIAIFYITEPWFMYLECYVWLSNISKKYGLSNDDFLLVSSNLISSDMKKHYVNEKLIDDNFSILEFPYFFHRLWFRPGGFNSEKDKLQLNALLKTNIWHLRNTKKEKHFLCLNRRPHDHRVFMFSELMTNPKLKDKTITTLGGEKMINGQKFKEAIRRFVNENYKYGYKRLIDFIDTWDASENYELDVDMESHFETSSINLDLHHTTFCNIVTETSWAEDVVFISEKTVKPIYALQPFIIFGNRGTIKKLHELGFKTFDKWWDESYDDLKFQNRCEKIIEIVEQISQWDQNKIKQVLVEMEETLIYNYTHLINNKITFDFIKKLTPWYSYTHTSQKKTIGNSTPNFI